MASFQENDCSPRQNWALKSHSEQQQKLGFTSSGVSQSTVDVTEESLVRKFENVGLKPNENVTAGDDFNNSGGINGSSMLPLRPHADDCPYYLRTGTCKFGLSCKYNHSVKRTIKVNYERNNEGLSEKSGQIECKYYLTAGGCKYGNSCRFSHPKPEPEIALPELNFLGLPIRLGEKECPFYMRNGSCGYGIGCRFHHPDHTSCGGADFGNSTFGGYSAGQVNYSSGNFNGEYVGFHSAELSYYSTVVSDVAGTYGGNGSCYMPSTSSLPQGTSQNREFNGYQVPDNSLKKTVHPPRSAPPAKLTMEEKQEFSVEVQELPQRSGQPDCGFYMRYGGCILRSDCRFHHPKDRLPQETDVVFTEKGLPLRPGQSVCHVYQHHGLCKFGPMCPYDHPLIYDPIVPPRTYEPPVPSVSAPMRTWYDEDEFEDYGGAGAAAAGGGIWKNV